MVPQRYGKANRNSRANGGRPLSVGILATVGPRKCTPCHLLPNACTIVRQAVPCERAALRTLSWQCHDSHTNCLRSLSPRIKFDMRVFLAGIMQGSLRESALHAQDYRGRLRDLLALHLETTEIYDPLAGHGESLGYDESLGREVFLRHNQMCCEFDIVLAFIPEASMGTAIEIWEAHRHGRLVVTISPLVHNWAVRFLSDVRYESLEAFEQELISGRFAERLPAARNAASHRGLPSIRGDNSGT
jgi:hypothetical protein